MSRPLEVIETSPGTMGVLKSPCRSISNGTVKSRLVRLRVIFPISMSNEAFVESLSEVACLGALAAGVVVVAVVAGVAVVGVAGRVVSSRCSVVALPSTLASLGLVVVGLVVSGATVVRVSK